MSDSTAASQAFNEMINSLRQQVRELSELLLSIEKPYKEKTPLPSKVISYWNRFNNRFIGDE